MLFTNNEIRKMISSSEYCRRYKGRMILEIKGQEILLEKKKDGWMVVKEFNSR